MDDKSEISKQVEDSSTVAANTVSVTLCKDYVSTSQAGVNEMKKPPLKLKGLLEFLDDSKKSCAVLADHSLSSDMSSSSDSKNQRVILKTNNYHFTGHFTRGAKKCLESALSKGLFNDSVTEAKAAMYTNSVCSSSSQTTPSSDRLTLATSATTSAPAAFITNLAAPTRAGTTELSLSSSTNRFTEPYPIIAHILTGEDRNLGADPVTTAATTSSSCGTSLPDDKSFEEQDTHLNEECGDMYSFLHDTMCDTSIGEKLSNGTSSWLDSTVRHPFWKEIDNNRLSTCSDKEPTGTTQEPYSKSACSTVMAATENNATSMLLVKEETKSDELRYKIMQALHISSIKVASPREAVDVCNGDDFPLIWVCVSTPVQDELLSVISAIRYSGRKSENSYIIAVTDAQPEVDLLLRGFDEICVEPLSQNVIHQKYLKFQWATTADLSDTDDAVTSRDATNTPESTISLESVRTTECSQSSVCDSVSSGMDVNDLNFTDLKCALSVPQSPFLSNDSVHDRSPVREPPSSPNWCRVEHATKEKQRSISRELPVHTEKMRRERIKDSCDQLRVLLPYVRGRKTDMASILEMTVDYLKIVNAALPQEFQSQVIDIMSNGGSDLEVRMAEMKRMNMANKRINKRKAIGMDASLGQPVHDLEENSNIQTFALCNGDSSFSARMLTRSSSRSVGSAVTADNSGSSSTSIKNCFNSSSITSTFSGIIVPKRECPPTTKTGSSLAKRPHMALLSGIEDSQSPSVVYLPPGSVPPMKETKKETFSDDVPGQNHHFAGLQFPPLFSEGNITANRMLSTGHMASGSEMFSYPPNAQINAPITRPVTSEHSDLTATYGGMYFDGAFYHYYPTLQDSPSGGFFVAGGTGEYVNPNAVVPVSSYTPRVTAFTAAHKFDRTPSTEMERFGAGDNLEFLNNGSSASLRPSSS